MARRRGNGRNTGIRKNVSDMERYPNVIGLWN
jgi:hypothetical protein